MDTVVFVAAKGGVGKSTLASAVGVAAWLCGLGLSVAFLDLDPQGTLTSWWCHRGCDEPKLTSLDGASLRSVQTSFYEHGVDLLIVDCAPGFSSVTEEAVQAADLVVVPTLPGLLNREAIASTVEMVWRAGVPCCCVLNRAPIRSRLTAGEVRELRHRGTRLLPVVHNRAAVAEAMDVGLTAVEAEPPGMAGCELTALWEAILDELDRPRSSATTSHVTTIGEAPV